MFKSNYNFYLLLLIILDSFCHLFAKIRLSIKTIKQGSIVTKFTT